MVAGDPPTSAPLVMHRLFLRRATQRAARRRSAGPTHPGTGKRGPVGPVEWFMQLLPTIFNRRPEFRAGPAFPEHVGRDPHEGAEIARG